MERIVQLIKRGASTLTDSEIGELAKVVHKQPFYQAAHMLYAHALYLRHDAAYGTALRQAAISLPDRAALASLIEGEKVERKTAKKNNVTTDRTENLITGFLDSLPTEKPRRTALADSTTDYMAYLLQTEAENENSVSPLAGQELIDEFIGQKQGHRISFANRGDDELLTPELQENGEFFTETMARIYIKQGKYDKAIKIIERLSTKVPRKNTYFADQLRFLNLLIENNKHNKQ